MKRLWLMVLSLSVGATVVFAAPHQRAFAGDAYSIALLQTKVHVHSEFFYEWSLPLNRPAGVWIGLFKVGDSKWNQLGANGITIYDYIRKLEFGGGSAGAPGAESLVGPGTVLELRMYSQDRSKLYAKSPPILVVDDATPIETVPSYVKGLNATYAITTMQTTVHGLDLLQYSTLAPVGHPFLLVGLYRMSEPSAWKPVWSLNWIDWPPFNGGDGRGLIHVPNPLEGVPVGTVLELRIYSQDRSKLYARSCPIVVVADTVSLPTTPLLCTATQ